MLTNFVIHNMNSE